MPRTWPGSFDGCRCELRSTRRCSSSPPEENDMATMLRPLLFKTETALPHIGIVTLPPAMQERVCASDRPLVLFPVRLETRFFAQPDGSSELRVRVYPDKVHLDSHEPE